MGCSSSPGRRPAATGHARPAGSWPPAGRPGRDAPLASRKGIRVPPFMTRRQATGAAWPLQDLLELGALASAVPCARLHARQVLSEWGLASLGESAGLIVTELITNAVKASAALTQVFPVRLWLASDLTRVLIVVWDASPQPPARVDASSEAEHGRGLMLVGAVSDEWGWYCRDDTCGKFVWATI